MSSFSALIVTGEVLPVAVLGIPWVEFAVRRCHALGAGNIVLVVERVDRDLVTLVDRLRAQGIALNVARHGTAIADEFHPDEAVLMWSGPAIVDPAILAPLATSGVAALLTTVAADSRFERLDAVDAWVGFARIDGGLVRLLPPDAAEWHLGATLARLTVQSGAERVAIAPESVGDALTAAGADQAARQLVAAARRPSRGWGDYWCVEPSAHAFATAMRSRLSLVARLGHWIAFGALALTLVAALSHLAMLSAIALLMATVFVSISEIACRATAISTAAADPATRAVPFVAATALLVTFLPTSINWGPLATALALIAAILLGTRVAPVKIGVAWQPDIAGSAMLLATGAAFGASGAVVALLMATLHAFTGLAWTQDRLSPVLTQHD